MDHLDVQKRSWNMSRIRSKNTRPELTLRTILYRLGLKYRLHQKELPGKPDIVLSNEYKAVILIHGCFWHQHKKCKRAHMPKSNFNYWKSKLERNIERDKINAKALRREKWKVIIVWECELKNPEDLKIKLIKNLV